MAYKPEIAEIICARIAEGETLRAICREDGMPSFRTVYTWQDEQPEFAARIASARAQGEDVIAQECLAIADDGTNDWMEQHSEGAAAAAYKLNGEHVQRAKLRIDTRLKLLAKWNPRRWGDKVQTELTGANGGPVQIIATDHDEAL
jgi:hypothetical protein